MRPQLRGRRGRWGGRGPIMYSDLPPSACGALILLKTALVMYRDLLPTRDETTAQGQGGSYNVQGPPPISLRSTYTTGDGIRKWRGKGLLIFYKLNANIYLINAW